MANVLAFLDGEKPEKRPYLDWHGDARIVIDYLLSCTYPRGSYTPLMCSRIRLPSDRSELKIDPIEGVLPKPWNVPPRLPGLRAQDKNLRRELRELHALERPSLNALSYK